MYDIIYKKLTNNSNHLQYVTSRFQDLKAASIKLNMLDKIMKQYKLNNFVPEPRQHYISVTILLILIILAWCFSIDKLCTTKRNVKLLPLTIRKAKTILDEDFNN